MAGRIVATVLALITALLASVAVPLGLLTADQDRRDYRAEAATAAATLANIAEERLGDRTADPGLTRSVAALTRAGDRVTVYDEAGQAVAGSRGAPVRAGRPPPGHVVVTAPIVPDSGSGRIGRVVLARPGGPLRRQVARLWTLIAGVSAAGLVIAVLVALALAGWVSRPLTTLAGAARDLGGGALGARSRVTAGPAEVRRLSETFDTMAARIESLVRGQRTMMADVSHQVRTPLAALRLRLDLLAQDTDGHTAAELAGAQEEIARLARLVNGVLAVARAESVPANPVRVAAAAVLRDRAAAWGPAAEEHGVTLTVAPGEPVTALAGAGHLEQILDNLLANALEAVPGGGVIQVGAARAESGGTGTAGGTAGAVARITVRDNGPGMTPEQQAAALRRFATSAVGGTGLGLTIVDRLAVANGGRAGLSGTPGGGLTVTVDLPAADPPAPARRSGDGARAAGPDHG
jgi:signal transduction histidine kinase